MPFVRAFKEIATSSACFLNPCSILHALEALLLHSSVLFHLNGANNHTANSGRLCVESFAMDNQIEKRDALISIHMHLVSDTSRLRQDLSKAFNGIRVSLETHVDHATIVVVSDDLNRVCAMHD